MSQQDPQVRAIGIFGGTFDPVHFGHLRAAVEAREKLGLDDFRLLPAGEPPHRGKTSASAVQRLDMLRLAIAGCPGLQVDDREIRRAGSSFMVDTLEDLRRESPASPLLLLIGQDAANGLDRWHRWPALFDLAHLVVMRLAARAICAGRSNNAACPSASGCCDPRPAACSHSKSPSSTFPPRRSVRCLPVVAPRISCCPLPCWTTFAPTASIMPAELRRHMPFAAPAGTG